MPVPGSIGRHPDSGLVLEDPEVSTVHAELRAGGVVCDQGSANGLWADGKRVHTHSAMSAPVRLGKTTVQVLWTGEEQPEVIGIWRAGEQRRHRMVIRLPAVITLAPSMKVVPQGGLALLPASDRIRLLHWLDGALVYVDPDGDGLVMIDGHHLDVSPAREVVSLPTDLVFDGGQVRLRQSVEPQEKHFPPPVFLQPVVELAALRRVGIPVIESRFLALGGGLGSFCWVDALRIHGVRRDDIRAVGVESSPYARYARLCRNSQIPDHERLRSNSESCPDNYWGFPGYGLREAWTELRRARVGAALGTLWQLYAEPDRGATYTPKAGDVFSALDREAARIGWGEILQIGRIRTIRKTDDGRYAVAVSSRSAPDAPRAIYLAPNVHVALGYPGVQFLPDLRTYREKTRDFDRVVNAYEDHSALYTHLQMHGGTVVLRGRGIVASRVLQRIYETRQVGGDVRVVHLMRGPKERGTRAGLAQRSVENHWEFQPFNWPEACWGGDLRAELSESTPAKRQELLGTWGGTTTADRADWRQIVAEGVRAGWYQIVFATVEHLSGDADGLSLSLAGGALQSVRCDAVIDATGLVSSIHANPVLADLTETYQLPLNVQGRFEIAPDFELPGMRNGEGRVFVAGVCTLGGHYAPVDSFLGLQYAAAASLDALSPSVPSLGPMSSLSAWWRWVRAVAP